MREYFKLMFGSIFYEGKVRGGEGIWNNFWFPQIGGFGGKGRE
jgi:hypothetical protein